MELIELFKKRHPELVAHVAPTEQGFVGYKGRRLLSTLQQEASWSGCSATCSMRMSFWDRTEFVLSPVITWIIRSRSGSATQEFKVQYLPAESNTGMFGGNSNWRGPVWMPVNVLIIRALLNLYGFYGDEFKVECPTGSGHYMTLFEVAKEIQRRLAGTFLRDANWQAAGLRRDRKVPGGSALARPHPVL